jgi:hypothetical protein
MVSFYEGDMLTFFVRLLNFFVGGDAGMGWGGLGSYSPMFPQARGDVGAGMCEYKTMRCLLRREFWETGSSGM